MSELSHQARFRRDHQWAPDQMSAYVDGELGSRSRARMKRHLAECAGCSRLLASLGRMLDELGHLPAPGGADPVGIAASVRLRLGEPPAS